ncbi:MAG: hypothetical protein P8Z37_01730 [Acidobacteriota bacterium]
MVTEQKKEGFGKYQSTPYIRFSTMLFNTISREERIMKKLRINLLLLLFACVVFTLPMQSYAADETHISQVFTFNTHGNTAAWLEGIQPIIARAKALNPQQYVHIHEDRFAGTGVGTINLVIEYPSMANMEQTRLKVNKDEEIAKLFANMADIEVELVSQSLMLDRAHDQVRLPSSPVEEVYTIDTHGKNDAFVAGSKKLHEAVYKKIPDISVRIWEATLSGENTGNIYIIVGYPSLADMERMADLIENDKEIQNLFTERDKVGATVVSCNLSTEVTP